MHNSTQPLDIYVVVHKKSWEDFSEVVGTVCKKYRQSVADKEVEQCSDSKMVTRPSAILIIIIETDNKPSDILRLIGDFHTLRYENETVYCIYWNCSRWKEEAI